MTASVLAPSPTTDPPSVDDEQLLVPPGPPVPDRAARGAAFAAVLALLAGALALPAGSLLGSGAFATLLAGSLEVREGEGWRTVPVGATVDDGDELRAVGGLATLDVGTGRLVLGAGAGAVVDGARLSVERGTVLVEDVEPRTLVVDGVATTGTGVWRADAGTRPRLATYGGTLEASDGSATASLASYRQLTIRDRAIGGAPAVPLRYLATDRFDVVHVAEALRVDTVAAALERSLAGTYGEGSREPAFYGAFVVDDDATVLPRLGDLAPIVEDDRVGPPAPVLLGIAVAEAVATLTDRPLDAALDHVVTMRAEGASWGLLLLEAGGGADELSGAAERTLHQAATDPPPPAPADEDAVAADVAAADAGTGDAAEGGGADTGGTAGAGGAAPGPGGGGGGSDTAPELPRPGSPDEPSLPRPPATPAPVPDAVDEVGSTVGDLLEDTVTDVEDAVDEVVRGVGRGVGGALGGGGNGGGPPAGRGNAGDGR